MSKPKDNPAPASDDDAGDDDPQMDAFKKAAKKLLCARPENAPTDDKGGSSDSRKSGP